MHGMRIEIGLEVGMGQRMGMWMRMDTGIGMGNRNGKELNIILKIIFILLVCPKSYVYTFCNRHYGLYNIHLY